MRYLIDGYNLLFEAGIPGKRDDQDLPPGDLDAARWRLIRQITAHLSDQDLCQTTIVFDAQHAPAHLESRLEFQGLQIVFARDHAQADDLIEEMIQRESAPKRLSVITSDLRLQDAAKRRRATVIDSDTWMVELESRPIIPDKPIQADEPDELTEDEVQQWLREFE